MKKANEIASEILKGSLCENYEETPEIIKRIESALQSYARERLENIIVECNSRLFPSAKSSWEHGYNTALGRIIETIEQQIEELK